MQWTIVKRHSLSALYTTKTREYGVNTHLAKIHLHNENIYYSINVYICGCVLFQVICAFKGFFQHRFFFVLSVAPSVFYSPSRIIFVSSLQMLKSSYPIQHLRISVDLIYWNQTIFYARCPTLHYLLSPKFKILVIEIFYFCIFCNERAYTLKKVNKFCVTILSFLILLTNNTHFRST